VHNIRNLGGGSAIYVVKFTLCFICFW